MRCAARGDHGSRKLEHALFCNPTFNETRSQSTNLEAGLRLVDLYPLPSKLSNGQDQEYEWSRQEVGTR
ncbi:hypothetical protein CDV36_009091 [Fusarium kuroshium]|uniref:Uncharacterized protein n=2 Tax=Fusarium solani species complex TaxID=232080 RepID=A0A3M2S194_9HYPO|nr:hypothetical protein CDV36_009091 [Fusarium kuroshium]RSM16524.1 hypothetical protein CEP52_000222 [Fusarium oligoseptatum]